MPDALRRRQSALQFVAGAEEDRERRRPFAEISGAVWAELGATENLKSSRVAFVILLDNWRRYPIRNPERWPSGRVFSWSAQIRRTAACLVQTACATPASPPGWRRGRVGPG